MSIRKKLIVCFGLTHAFFLLFVGFLVYQSGALQKELSEINQFHLPASRQTVEIYGQVQSLAEDMRRFYFRPTPSAEQTAFARMARDLYPYIIEKRFKELEELLVTHHKQSSLGVLKKAKASYKNLTHQESLAGFDKVYGNFRSELRAFSKNMENESMVLSSNLREQIHKSLVTLAFFSLLLFVFSILVLRYSQNILEPLPALVESLREIARGNFKQSLKVSPSGKSEFAVLARAFNKMLEALKMRDEQILFQQNELLAKERLAAVGQLSAEIVHEVRNPLNAISLNIDWLQTQLPPQALEERASLKSVLKEVERLTQITESYLVRSKLPSMEEEKSSEATEIRALLGEIIAFSREEDKSQKIRVEVDLGEDPIYISGSKPKLKQAFLNVIKNAKEAMPRGGQLKIRTVIENNVSKILISDTGAGMNQGVFKKSFHPFFTTKSAGTGLGLSVTKKIIEEACGTISCESQMGQGTTFSFQFPLQAR